MDLRDLEVPVYSSSSSSSSASSSSSFSSSSWIPITPVRASLPRRPPTVAGAGPAGHPLSSNCGMKSTSAFGSNWSDGSFPPGSQWQNVGSYTSCLPNYSAYHHHFNNSKELGASGRQSQHLLPKPNMQVTSSSVRQWTQATHGDNVRHLHSPFHSVRSIGVSQQQAQAQQLFLLNGKIPLHPQVSSGNSQNDQLSHNGAFNPYLPKGYHFYPPEIAARIAGKDTVVTPIGSMTSDKCRRVEGGHVIESSNLEDWGCSIEENRQDKQHTASNVKDSFEICFSQGSIRPSTIMPGEFSLLLQTQHQKAENRHAASNRIASATLAPVTPEKDISIHYGLPAEAIKLVDHGGTKKNHQKMNENLEIERVHMSDYHFQGASGQTDLSPFKCFQQHQENKEHEIAKIQGTDVNKTPLQNSKKKKHRPKVIREGKPARKPRQMTPKSTSNTVLERPSGKRKYVRKKKADVDTPSSKARKTSKIGDTSVQRSAKRSLNFDLEAVLYDESESSSMRSDYSVYSRDPNEGRSSHTGGSSRGSVPLPQGLEKVVDPTNVLFTLNPIKEVSGKQTRPCNISDQAPAPSWNHNYIRENQGSSGHTLHRLTPETILALNFADDAAVTEGLQKECNVSSNATNQSHTNVVVGDNHQRDDSINNASIYPYNGDEVNHLPEVNKKRKAGEELDLTSNNKQLSFSGKEVVITCGKKHPEQVMGYVQTEGTRTDLFNSPAKICSQLVPTPTKDNNCKLMSSVGRVSEGKNIHVTPSRRKHHTTNANNIGYEQACQLEFEVFGSGTPCRKDSQQTQNNALKSQQSQRSRKKENDPSFSICAMAPPADPLDLIALKMKSLYIGEGHVENVNEDLLLQGALVPYHGDGTMVPFEGPLGPSKKRFPRAKVDLDSETNRVWLLLMGKDANSDGALGKNKEKWWEEERRVFRGRVDSFIARMHLVQGDRRFSQWKGSVVDSVIGVFLTQNVSDHLSSSAFMALAARFPVHSNEKSRESSTVIESNPAINKVVTVVEIEGDDDLQDNISNQIPGQNLSNIGKTHCTKENDTEYCEATGRNTEAFVFDISNERNIDKYGTENKQDITPLENNTPTALSSREQISNAEVDDVKSAENGFSQNSVISSQNSSDSPVQTVDRTGNLETHSDIEGMLHGTSWNCLEDSTPFSTLLQLADAGTFQGFYTNGSGITASKESLANANKALEYSGLGESQSMFKLNDVYTSNRTFEPNNGYISDVGVKSHESHNYTMSSSVSSTSHIHSASDFGMIGTVGDDVSGKGSSFFTSLMSEINNITCMGNYGSKGSLLDRSEISVQEESLTTSQSLRMVDQCCNTDKFPANKLMSSAKKEVNFDENLFNLSYVPREFSESISNINPYKGLTNVQPGKNEQSEREVTYQREQGTTISTIQNSDCRSSELHSEPTHCNSSSDDAKSSNAMGNGREASAGTKGWVSANGGTITDATKETAKNKVKPVNKKAKKELKDNFDWDSLRKEVCKCGSRKERSYNTMDSVDWEAVRNADVNQISNVIRERGMNNMLAERIKDFIDRLVREHGSIDLEWLRDIPPDKAKDYLLSIRGLGLKSVECVRLLTLHHLAFPVDTNVGRICVRLGWVPLQPLPESLQLHLLELYPMLETIQKYLWPRLCTLDQRTLYELHYQLITFGKVFCTKSKPNCNACPMRGECKHFASAFASARLALPGLEENGLVPLTNPSASEMVYKPASYPISLPQLEDIPVSRGAVINNSEPIIEEPTTPEPECLDHLESAIENFDEVPDEIPTIKLNIEQFTQNLQDIFQGNNMELQDGDMSKALVALTPEVASIPQPKLKNVSRLRTEHQVYEVPDSHPLLEGLDQREVDDPCPYLLAIWTPGETAQSTESPDITCTAQDKGKLCDSETCFNCNCIRETQAQTVRGTFLIPCRTAMRGSFPLNGTYFQVNEVFADHSSSLTPVVVPREWLWSLPRRTVYFGTSVTSIFRGLTTEGIQQCFWRGFICVRGFDQKTRAPRPLLARLHFPASKVVKNKKTASNEE